MNKKFFKFICFMYLCFFALDTFVFAADGAAACLTYADIINDLQNIFNFVKVVIPLLIVGLSTFEFIKALADKDDKKIKKSFTRLTKRMIFAVLFFFLPVLLNLLFSLIIEDINVCIK